MTSRPRLSVIIPSYNAARFLPETLCSLINQFSDLEIIIVDDGSTDNTATVVRPFLSDRVRYVRISNSGGPAAPRNHGIQLASAPLIGFFDADDVAIEGTLEVSVDLMERYSFAGMLCTNFHIGDENLNLIKHRVADEKAGLDEALKRALEPGVWHLSSRDAFSALLRNNFVGTPSVIIRRDVFEQVGGYDEALKNLDDRDMWLRVAKQFDLIYRDVPTFIYRTVASSISRHAFERQASERVYVGKKLLSGELSTPDRRLLKQWIAHNELAIAHGQFEKGLKARALTSFIHSFIYSPSWVALKGTLKSIMPHSLYRRLR